MLKQRGNLGGIANKPGVSLPYVRVVLMLSEWVDFHYAVNGKIFDFSIPGGGFVSLAHLVEVMGIANTDSQRETVENNFSTYEEAVNLNSVTVSEKTREFMADVTNVEFSNPELVWVGKVNEGITVREIKTGNNLECEYSEELTEEQITEINAQTVEAGDWALISVKPFMSEETLTVTMKYGEVFTVKVTDLNENPFGLSGKKFKIVNSSYAMTRNQSNNSTYHSYLRSSTNLSYSETWEFEYTGTGTEYLLKDSQGRYLIMDTANGLTFTTNKDYALAHPIVVKETIASNGKRGYVFMDSSAEHCLRYGSGAFYMIDGSVDLKDPNCCMELRDITA